MVINYCGGEEKMNKKESKFHFVSNEEMLNEEEKVEETLEDEISFVDEKNKSEVDMALDEMQIVKDAKLDELRTAEANSDDEDIQEFEFVDEERPVIEEKNKINEEPKTTKNGFNKIYIGFEVRVLILVLIVLCLFFGACYFIMEACNFSKDKIVTYSENSEVNYNVCVSSSDYYNKPCLKEGLEYLPEITNNIKVSFKYNVTFSTEIDYNLAYHVVAITKVYDKKDNKKIFFENEDLLVEKIDISDYSDIVDLNREIDFDYHKYNNLVKGYQERYGVDAASTLELVLYLDEEAETRTVASLTMPLGENSFGITKNSISNNDKEVQLDNDVWNDYNVMCAICASVLIILALLVLFKTTSLVLKATPNKSKYQMMLEKILKEYDELIVTTKEGYSANLEKEIIKVASFKELVDARNALGKPILYTKINDVKSEFIVEDTDKIYKYVIKEAHFLDK